MTSAELTLSASVVDQLRRVLEAREFSASVIREAFGVEEDAPLWSADGTACIRARLGDVGQDLAVLTGLFVLGATVDVGQLEAALAPLEPANLGDVLLRGESGVRSRLSLIPEDDLLIVSDRDTTGKRFVPGVNNAAVTLGRLTVRAPVVDALDVGTGCGVQALRAAGHAGRVTGTDINPRALRYAEMAARLNGIDNVEWLRGSWFEPVEDRTFDLVVVNPPYVISPDTSHLFRDSGLPGDQVSHRVVSSVPSHLRPGGLATIMCNWIHRADEDPFDPLRAWVAGSGCDAILLRYGTNDPLTYAARWNQPLRDSDTRAFRRAVTRWVRYYEQSGIEAIGFGGVVLRRPGPRHEPRFVRAVDAQEGPSGQAGDHLLRLFEAEDRGAVDLDDAALLASSLSLIEGHRLDQTLVYRSGRYEAMPATLRLLSGVGLAGTVDPRVLSALLQCNGGRPLASVVEDVADEIGVPADDLRPVAAETARRLIADGLLLATGPDW